MNKKLSRRDFLKLASILPLSLSLPGNISPDSEKKPNILVVLFDSWSAANTSLYGYPRQTTPNIDQLAEKAIVYHNHYASGHYTYPSTASFLTGVLPWKHKGYWGNPQERILNQYSRQNLFHYLPEYHRSAYTHNSLANRLLLDMVSEMDDYLPKNALSLNPIEWFDQLFQNDGDIATISWIRNLIRRENGLSSSLFFSRLLDTLRSDKLSVYQDQFPRGVPLLSVKDSFLLETATDWMTDSLAASPAPFFSYVHLLPPHSPYRTRKEFVGRFSSDDYQPIEKPIHPLGSESIRHKDQVQSRVLYDEFLLYVDAEFKRLMDNLSRNGLLENTIVILTSDHGEMFERGIVEHLIPNFHRPLMHIPLVIFHPKMQERIDVHTPTTTIDLLPTILHLAGNPLPGGLEGHTLPPFSTTDQTGRTVFSLDFRRSDRSGPVSDGTIMLRSGDYKFTYFFGTRRYYSALPDAQYWELYDLANDPEEIDNLFDPADPLSQTFQRMMEEKLNEMGLELVQYN